MIRRFGKYALLPLAALLALSAFCAEEPSAQEFLERARTPRAASTYGKFYGSLQHRRRGQEPEEMRIYFGVIITPRETIGRILVNRADERILVNRTEAYVIRQTRDPGREGTSVGRDPKDGRILDDVGLRASDLTMSFLHYKLVKELDSSTLSAVVSCRVLLLESPDDNPGGKEYVKVYLEKDHAFPLKAEFFRQPDDKRPFRLMEVNGFTKKNDLYYARTILIEGPGWRTKVEFEQKAVVIGIFDESIPRAGVLFPDALR